MIKLVFHAAVAVAAGYLVVQQFPQATSALVHWTGARAGALAESVHGVWSSPPEAAALSRPSPLDVDHPPRTVRPDGAGSRPRPGVPRGGTNRPRRRRHPSPPCRGMPRRPLTRRTPRPTRPAPGSPAAARPTSRRPGRGWRPSRRWRSAWTACRSRGCARVANGPAWRTGPSWRWGARAFGLLVLVMAMGDLLLERVAPPAEAEPAAPEEESREQGVRMAAFVLPPPPEAPAPSAPEAAPPATLETDPPAASDADRMEAMATPEAASSADAECGRQRVGSARRGAGQPPARSRRAWRPAALAHCVAEVRGRARPARSVLPRLRGRSQRPAASGRAGGDRAWRHRRRVGPLQRRGPAH